MHLPLLALLPARSGGGAACCSWGDTRCWSSIRQRILIKPHTSRTSAAWQTVLALRAGLLISMWILLQVMDALMADPRLGRNLTAPSISAGRANLYMRGDCPGFKRVVLHLARLPGARRPCSGHCR